MIRLRTINESIAILSIDDSQAPDNCEQCGKPCSDLRPYGKDGAWVCFPCGMADPEETEKNFGKVLDGEKLKGVEMTTIDEAKDTNIAVDFDATIHSYKNGFKENKFDAPVKGAIDALNQLAKAYKNVFIFTAREKLDPVENYIKEEFDKAGIAYPRNISVTNEKPPADVYIDDRGYKFEGDWAKTLADVKKYKTWMNENRLPSFKESYARRKNR